MSAYHYQQGDRPLDGYTIHYALGRGGFGEVYFAVSDSGREVALKAVQNYEDVELRGIGHCMNLKSPHLVMIFDVKRSEDGVPWVIMEYVSGPSLRDVLDESPAGLGIDQTKFFLKELAKGLSYLHEAGVVHRDLKPHNVFFEDGIVKIGDYSLSKVITASHRSGNTMTVGSVHYMAPEISMGRYDKTVDVYALGVVLYEMLTGQPPYVGESLGEVLMKHLSSQPDVSQLPEPFASAVLKAMQRDPADRFQTAWEMVEAIGVAEPAQPLSDGFNPATLSLVGERVRAAKKQQAVAHISEQEVAVEVAPPLSHSTAPTAVQDTSVYAESGSASSADNTRAAESLPLLQRLGLHYYPPKYVHEIPDPIWLGWRLLLAAVATLALTTIALSLQQQVSWGHGWPTIPLATVMLSGTIAAVASRCLPRKSGFAWAVISRFAWALAVQLSWPLMRVSMEMTDRVCMEVAVCLMNPVLVFDWRCLVAAHRERRVSVFYVVLMGAHVVLIHSRLQNLESMTIFAAAVMMAAAITVQLVAPLRKAAANAPLVPPVARSGKPPKPRLLYDKTAVVLELIIGVAIASSVVFHMNGGNQGAIGAMGVVALFALRFRLARRAWPDTTVEQLRPSTEANEIEQVDPNHQKPHTTTSDKTAIRLEFLFLACVILIGSVFHFGGDDLMPFVAAPAMIAFLCLRYRFRRRGRIFPEKTGQRRLSFDRVSIFLELLIGACVATIIAVSSEFGNVRIAAAVVAIVTLRFRLARRVAAIPATTAHSKELQESH